MNQVPNFFCCGRCRIPLCMSAFMAIVTDCGHVFHWNCISEFWHHDYDFNKVQQQPENQMCPLCNKLVSVCTRLERDNVIARYVPQPMGREERTLCPPPGFKNHLAVPSAPHQQAAIWQRNPWFPHSQIGYFPVLRGRGQVVESHQVINQEVVRTERTRQVISTSAQEKLQQLVRATLPVSTAIVNPVVPPNPIEIPCSPWDSSKLGEQFSEEVWKGQTDQPIHMPSNDVDHNESLTVMLTKSNGSSVSSLNSTSQSSTETDGVKDNENIEEKQRRSRGERRKYMLTVGEKVLKPKPISFATTVHEEAKISFSAKTQQTEELSILDFEPNSVKQFLVKVGKHPSFKLASEWIKVNVDKNKLAEFVETAIRLVVKGRSGQEGDIRIPHVIYTLRLLVATKMMSRADLLAAVDHSINCVIRDLYGFLEASGIEVLDGVIDFLVGWYWKEPNLAWLMKLASPGTGNVSSDIFWRIVNRLRRTLSDKEVRAVYHATPGMPNHPKSDCLWLFQNEALLPFKETYEAGQSLLARFMGYHPGMSGHAISTDWLCSYAWKLKDNGWGWDADILKKYAFWLPLPNKAISVIVLDQIKVFVDQKNLPFEISEQRKREIINFLRHLQLIGKF